MSAIDITVAQQGYMEYAMEPIPAGAAGVLTEGMMEAIAEWYSRNLSENVTRGMSDNARKCVSNGSPIYGYRRGPDGRYILQPEEAAAVRSVFLRYGQGFSAACIAAFAFILLMPQNADENLAIAYIDGKELADQTLAMQMGQEALAEIFSNGNQEQQLTELFNEP